MLGNSGKNAIPYESEEEWVICWVGCGENADRRMSMVIIFIHLIGHWVHLSIQLQVVEIELMSETLETES